MSGLMGRSRRTPNRTSTRSSCRPSGPGARPVSAPLPSEHAHPRGLELLQCLAALPSLSTAASAPCPSLRRQLCVGARCTWWMDRYVADGGRAHCRASFTRWVCSERATVFPRPGPECVAVPPALASLGCSRYQQPRGCVLLLRPWAALRPRPLAHDSVQRLFSVLPWRHVLRGSISLYRSGSWLASFVAVPPQAALSLWSPAACRGEIRSTISGAACAAVALRCTSRTPRWCSPCCVQCPSSALTTRSLADLACGVQDCHVQADAVELRAGTWAAVGLAELRIGHGCTYVTCGGGIVLSSLGFCSLPPASKMRWRQCGRLSAMNGRCLKIGARRSRTR